LSFIDEFTLQREVGRRFRFPRVSLTRPDIVRVGPNVIKLFRSDGTIALTRYSEARDPSAFPNND